MIDTGGSGIDRATASTRSRQPREGMWGQTWRTAGLVLLDADEKDPAVDRGRRHVPGVLTVVALAEHHLRLQLDVVGLLKSPSAAVVARSVS